MKPGKKEQLFTLISTVLGIPAQDVTFELAVGSIPQWDSLAHVGLISAIEERFSVTFDVDQLFEFETVEDIFDALED